MLDTLMFVVFPYVALVTLVIGTIWRFKTSAFQISAMSSQFLEREGVFWGSMPWHLGIIIVLLGHFISFVFPAFLRAMTSTTGTLITIEIIGLGAGITALIGLTLLLLRRLWNKQIDVTTTKMDWVVLLLLLVQVSTGILVAIFNRWGSQWSVQTTTPYFWSILTLSPDGQMMADMSGLIKAHVFFAWVFVFVIPFSRLIHIFTVPLQYFGRVPQIVIWNSRRK